MFVQLTEEQITNLDRSGLSEEIERAGAEGNRAYCAGESTDEIDEYCNVLEAEYGDRYYSKC